IGGDVAWVVTVLVGGAALVPIVRAQRDDERRSIVALAAIVAVTIVVAFVASQISPAWTDRYFAVVLGPVLLLAAHGAVRARMLGVALLVAVVFVYGGFSVKNDKENARGITQGVQPYLT